MRRQDDRPEHGQRPGADVAGRLDGGVRDIAEPRHQDQHGQGQVVPGEADNRTPGGEVGRRRLGQMHGVEQDVHHAVRPEHANEGIAQDDRGHEQRKDREALHIGGEPAAGEAQIKRQRQAEEQQQHGDDRRRPQRQPQIAEAVGVGEKELIGLERDQAWPHRACRCQIVATMADEDRPDHQPDDQQNRHGDEQQAEKPPALCRRSRTLSLPEIVTNPW